MLLSIIVPCYNEDEDDSVLRPRNEGDDGRRRETLLSSTSVVSSKVDRKILLLSVGVLSLTFAIRFLTLQFMRAHLNDPGWFQTGSYAIFDLQARAILDGQQPVFWINDSTRTDLARYPPGFPALVALLYKVTGEHSAFSVQTVQWILDFVLSLGLIAGIAGTAFGWRVLCSGFGCVFASPGVVALILRLICQPHGAYLEAHGWSSPLSAPVWGSHWLQDSPSVLPAGFA